MNHGAGPEETGRIAAAVETFVREVVVPYETDSRRDTHEVTTRGGDYRDDCRDPLQPGGERRGDVRAGSAVRSPLGDLALDAEDRITNDNQNDPLPRA